MSKENKMDPETAVKILKVLSKWMKTQHAWTKSDAEVQNALDEAIFIAIAALEEKTEL